MIRISFVGDINPGGVLTYTGGVSQDVIDLLSEADLRVGTLECSIGDGSTPCHVKMADPKNGTIIYAPDESVNLLKEMHIDVVSLANNHAFDLDDEGFRHTLSVLDEAGIKYVGAGMNINEASKPLILSIHGKTFCFLAYLEQRIPCIRLATETEAGANPFEIGKVVSDIKKYKTTYDYVIVMPHWGKENALCPKLKVVGWCKELSNAGADAVIGSHTHIFQPIIKRNNTVIAYSMGNFLFPDRYIDSPRRTVYPSSAQRNEGAIPVVEGFPLVDQLSYKVVGEKARIGGVLTLCYDGDADTKAYTVVNTYLNSENELVVKNMPQNDFSEYQDLQKYCKSVFCLKLYFHKRSLRNRTRKYLHM